MHFETTNLPADIEEVFFSDVYFYASSRARTALGRPKFVGCGITREEAFADLRHAAATATHDRQDALAGRTYNDDHVALSDVQRQALARNLRQLRAATHHSQQHVARVALGFEKSHAALSRLERGVLLTAGRAHIERLAEFYGTTVQALLL